MYSSLSGGKNLMRFLRRLLLIVSVIAAIVVIIVEMPTITSLARYAYQTVADWFKRDIPPGVIVMWLGSPNEVPEGWALCNGTNGTPDLTDRFIAECIDVANRGSYEIEGDGDRHSHDSNFATAAESSHDHSTISGHRPKVPLDTPDIRDERRGVGRREILDAMITAAGGKPSRRVLRVCRRRYKVVFIMKL